MASTDACETCGRLWMDRTSLRLRNGNLDGFQQICGFRWILTDLGGFCRTPQFWGGCAPMPAPNFCWRILIFKRAGCLTICELCCVQTSFPVYCLVPLFVSPLPHKSTSKICKLLPVVTAKVRTKEGIKYEKQGFPKNGVFLFLNMFVSLGRVGCAVRIWW